MAESIEQIKISQKLEDAVKYAAGNSPFYQKHLANIDLDNLEETFRQIPFTTKEHISGNNEDFLAVPRNKIAEYCTTSGTSGNPITVYLTKKDLERLAENERASMELMNGTSEDVFQLMTTIDKQFMAGLAYSLGVQKLNAGLIRTGPGSIPAQWDSIFKYKPTHIIAVPSFIVKMLDYAQLNGIDFKNSSVKRISCIGEPIRNDDFSLNSIGQKINNRWKVDLYSTYASTEMATAFSECEAQQGGHLNEDLVYLEVIDDNGNQVSDGEIGEVVVTPLNIEGTPILRYKTGDIARYHSSPCKSGRTTPRLGPIIGRKNQLIKYKGTSLYPQTIFNVLHQQGIDLFHLLVSKNELETDEITIFLAEKTMNDSQKEQLKVMLKSKTKVSPEIKFISLESLKNHIFIQDKRKPNYISFK